MDVSAALVAYPQPAELVQPTHGPLYHPAVHSQPAAVFRAPPSQGRRDVARPPRLRLYGRTPAVESYGHGNRRQRSYGNA